MVGYKVTKASIDDKDKIFHRSVLPNNYVYILTYGEDIKTEYGTELINSNFVLPH
jgi:hypothetical protein